MMVSDMRCYEIQQIDYADRFRVFNNLSEHIGDDFEFFTMMLNEIENEITTFEYRMRYIYELQSSSDFMKLLLDNLTDPSFAKYYYTISKERASALKYRRGNLEKEYKSIKSFSINQDKVLDEIKEAFIVGEKYTKSYIKEALRTIYENNGYNKTPKANDLEEYFEIKLCKVLDKTTGKSDNGFKIIKLKTEENDISN